MPLIDINSEKCRKCYACVRVCPVQAIKVDVESAIPSIVDSRCIGCGSCVTICHPGAVVFEDAREETKALLQSGQTVAAVVGSAIPGEFPDITDYRKFVEMIRRLGFTYVCEASFGVDLVAHKYAQLFANNKGKYYITANCPSVCFYIEKYHPELIENLAPIVPPMIAAAKVVHKRYGDDTRIVYIGACISKKKSAKRYQRTDGQVDAVLTFRELRQLFTEFDIKESKLEFSEFDPPFGNKGSLYPISNGVLQAANISEDLLKGSVITVEGRKNMIDAVHELEKHPQMINRHFNLFYDEGCLMGPGTSRGGQRFLRHTLVVNYSNKRIQNLNKREWAKNLKYFLNLDLSASFVNDDQRLPMPPFSKVKEVLQILGKDSPADSLGCGACGFTSCHDFAIAVAKGLVKPEMCITFSLYKRLEHADKLNDISHNLEKINEELTVTKRESAQYQQLADKAQQAVDTILQKLPVSFLLVDENLHIIQANQPLVQMLGSEAVEINEVIPGLAGADLKTLLPQPVYNLFSFVIANGEDIFNRDIHLLDDAMHNISIFTIRKNKVAGAVIRDMQSPEIRKEEVIKRITEVIDKNLEMVQKIGFLLGEGAAETEQMLNSIIEFYKTVK
ncbi:MAG: [Fe-Fe] hydrogenase large subunit C-terminal domain-containing protein [Bacteroidota bacterium]|nr:[Fe-Fe] hydrogenase large subunit C-terminal domain-containing protein [Bacteroidota bacterium]